MVESKLLGRKSEKKFFGPKPLKTRLSPKLHVFFDLACFSKLLEIERK